MKGDEGQVNDSSGNSGMTATYQDLMHTNSKNINSLLVVLQIIDYPTVQRRVKTAPSTNGSYIQPGNSGDSYYDMA